ncbi:MAG TPA: hypothetical protein VM010_02885, partial [Chitinophagaceae bacterium]|nr:hypothetical protein [Chitinophagaceae bacterium]
YTLRNDELTVTYKVENTGTKQMLFSVGAHPAFKVPLVAGTAYEDYRLQFEKEETTGRWPISKDGLIAKPVQPLLQNTNVLPLKRELFDTDAVVLKHLQSQVVTLASGKTPHGLHFTFEGFPFLGLWAAPGADFLCIEPWCGIADWVDTDQQLEHKEGIRHLPAGETFTVQWKARFF